MTEMSFNTIVSIQMYQAKPIAIKPGKTTKKQQQKRTTIGLTT